MLDATVITVNHHHQPTLMRCVDSILNPTPRCQLQYIVVDNTPHDGALEAVLRTHPAVTVMRNTTPQGFAHNINQAIAAAAPSRYLVLVNPDIIARPGLIDGLVTFMDAAEQANVGLAGPQLLNPNGSIQTSCRAFSTPVNVLLRGLHLDSVLGQTQLMRNYLLSDWDHATTRDVDWITGALMIVRRTAIAQVGVMDERYFLYSEDQDWCCRMWQAGWRVAYFPHVQAMHQHLRIGMRKPWSGAARHQLMSAVQMFHKFGWSLRRSP